MDEFLCYFSIEREDAHNYVIQLRDDSRHPFVPEYAGNKVGSDSIVGGRLPRALRSYLYSGGRAAQRETAEAGMATVNGYVDRTSCSMRGMFRFQL